MGSYTSLSVDSYRLLSTRGCVDPIMISLFTEADKIARFVRKIDRPEKWEITDDLPEDEKFLEVGYAASGAVILDRLEVMGFTLQSTRRKFENGVHTKLTECKEFEANNPSLSYVWNEEISFLSAVSFET